MASGKSAEAERILSVALKADPGNRDLRLELLEAACLNRSYQNAVAQVPLVKPIADTEAPSLFYAAVALYETGKTEEARVYLQRAMPKVSGVLVDEYAMRKSPLRRSPCRRRRIRAAGQAGVQHP